MSTVYAFSFIVIDARWCHGLDWASECPDVKITNEDLTRSGTGCYSCTHGSSGRQRVNCCRESSHSKGRQL